MRKDTIMNVAFDVDGTIALWNGTECKPNYQIIELMRRHWRLGDKIYVWSGGGIDYAQSICRRLGIENLVDGYLVKEKRSDIHLCYDDMEVNLAKRNIQI